MATDPRTYSVYGTLVRSTEKAMLIQVHSIVQLTSPQPEPTYLKEGAAPEWFPKTQILDYQITEPTEDPDSEPLDEFTVKHWILSEKGLVK